jgi:Ricin-type beta-trefoil lectin domain
MEVKDRVTTNGQRVIIGDCTGAGSGWRVDDNHMIHSELNDDFCLQAGYGGRHGMVGRVIRIQHCDDHNHLQRWRFTNGHELNPQMNDDLCAVWRGTTPNVGSDPMILLKCSEVRHKNKWMLA